MLVDRNLIIDLIALEPKRENGYRHPPCIIVLLSIQEEQEHAENCMKNTHVQEFELIEENLIQIHGLCCFSVYWCYAHECLFPVIHFLLYVVYVISWLN
jgi:hypothetical protein